MSVRKRLVDAHRKHIQRAVQQILAAHERELLARVERANCERMLEGSVRELCSMAGGRDPDPATMTDEEKEEFRRMNSGW